MPEPIRDTCEPGLIDGARIAVVTCAGPTVFAEYDQMADRASLDSAFDAFVVLAREPLDGTVCAEGPSQTVWVQPGRGSGRLACFSVAPDTLAVAWTDQTRDILGLGIASTTDYAALADWWLGAGPIDPGATPAPTPVPTPTATPEQTAAPTPQPISVPDLRNLPVQAARILLESDGLTLSTTTRETLDGFDGSILSQSPAPGTLVAPGSTIDVVVAQAPATVTVPDLAGLAEGDAYVQLTDAGLFLGKRIEKYNGKVKAGRVITTDPTAGTDVPPGSRVDVVVSKGRAPKR